MSMMTTTKFSRLLEDLLTSLPDADNITFKSVTRDEENGNAQFLSAIAGLKDVQMVMAMRDPEDSSNRTARMLVSLEDTDGNATTMRMRIEQGDADEIEHTLDAIIKMAEAD